MKNLPLGIQTFSEIIEGNYIYVDKTKEIAQLVNGSKYYFISRPRRFGKSLLISTLKEIFSGNQDLFKGLWIYDKIDWKKYPVIHIDFSGITYDTPDNLKKSVSHRIISIAEDNGISLDINLPFKDSFKELIRQVSEREKVVILIDEYDKPLVEFVDKPDIAIENRNILKSFYETIKESDQYVRFALLTGVSKFSRVSVFSGLNNLRDITLSEEFCTLFGYTEAEMKLYFTEYIEEMAKKLSLETDILKKEIKNWYNGYSWDGKNFVYNPFSVLYMFTEQNISNYWFTSGTPTFLIKVIKEYNVDVSSLENLEVGPSIFELFDINQMNVESLLFQTGYLTIKNIIRKSISRKHYILNYPNQEVKESFIQNLLRDFSGKSRIEVIIDKITESLEENNLDSFFNQLISIFADIPSEIFLPDRESYYHTIIYLVLTLIGTRINAEVHTNMGRIDAVIETDKKVYVFEFKMSNSTQAIKQIELKKYYQKYLASDKEILLVGVSFDKDKRNIKDWQVMVLVDG